MMIRTAKFLLSKTGPGLKHRLARVIRQLNKIRFVFQSDKMLEFFLISVLTVIKTE